MMTSARVEPVRFDPGELIAAIPALLRFAPQESVVLIGFVATSTPFTLRCAMRLDISTADAALDEVSDQLSSVVIAQELDQIVMVIIADGGHGDEDPPHQAVSRALLRVFDAASVDVADVLWASRIEPDMPWRSYLDPARTGTLPDPAGSPVTLAAVLDGEPIYASRADLVAHLAADPAPQLARRAAHLETLPVVEPDAGRALLHALLDQLVADPNSEVGFDEDTLVRAAHALTHPAVREAALACALTEQAATAERLWTILTRAIPAPVVAHPASLLATTVYLRGDGALAQVALDIALAADPEHPLAAPVRLCLNHATPPEQLRQLLATSFDAARAAAKVDASQ